jgi:hypothetical protein
MSAPWNEKTAPNRVRPRECIGNARDALNKAYGHPERAQIPLIIEAVDWLRRGLEQMVEPPAQGVHDRIDGLRPKGSMDGKQ